MNTSDSPPAPANPPDKPQPHRLSLSKLLSFLKPNKTTPLQMNNLQILNGEVVLKIVLVGEGTVGKSKFVLLCSKSSPPSTYTPTVFENYPIHLTHASTPFDLRLWDTSAQEHYDRLRPLSYLDANVICICFAVGDGESVQGVREKWAPEVQYFIRKGDIGAEVFLLGFWEEGGQGGAWEMGEKLAIEIGAQKYLECELSSKGVKDMLPTILGMVLEASPKLRKRVDEARG